MVDLIEHIRDSRIEEWQPQRLGRFEEKKAQKRLQKKPILTIGNFFFHDQPRNNGVHEIEHSFHRTVVAFSKIQKMVTPDQSKDVQKSYIFL